MIKAEKSQKFPSKNSKISRKILSKTLKFAAALSAVDGGISYKQLLRGYFGYTPLHTSGL